MKKYEDNVLEENKEGAVQKETLQTYFKDAYMRERERFNSMFGTLDYNPPFDYTDYNKKEETAETQKEILEDMVPLKKYKKSKRATVAFVILSLIFLGAAAFFGANYFGLL